MPSPDAQGEPPPDVAPVDEMQRGTGRTRRQLLRTPALTLAALSLVRQAAPRQLTAVFLLQLLGAAAIVAQLLFVKELITELVELDDGQGFDGWTLAPILAGLVVANVTSSMAAAAVASQQMLLADLVGHHTMNGIVAVSSRVGLASYEDPGFHDLLERARSAALYRPADIVAGVTQLATALLTSIGIVIALLTLEPVLVPLVLLAGVPVLLASLRNSRRTYQFEYSMTVHAREHLHLMELLTGPEYAKELRIFSSVGFLRARYDALTRERLVKLREFVRGRLRVSLLGTTAAGLGTAIALGSLLWLLATDRTDVATAGTAALAMQLLASRLVMVNTSVGRLVEGGMFLDDYHRFLDVPDRSEAPAPADAAPERFEGLRVEGLSFTYPQTARRVLDDIDLELRPGEVVALVGANGSGKTTLVKLLCRLYAEPEAGRILLGDRDLRELDAQTVRRHMTVLFQDFVRYELTVADNIALGRTDLGPDRERMLDAARRAGAHDMIERLPQGYETRLGRRFHGGADLSGGQWQRLALARAFYRGGDMLILDEPTAALDPRAEFELFQQVTELAAGRSVLLISHRFSSVRMADRIYVLEDGRIAETGTHDELVARAGVYAELYELQAAAYFGERRPAPE